MSSPNQHIKSRKLIFFNNQLILERQPEKYLIPNFATLPTWLNCEIKEHLLGTFNGSECHAIEIVDQIVLSAPYAWLPLKSAIDLLGAEWFNVAACAFQILAWDKNHRYCGRCGQTTQHQPSLFERRCLPCKLVFYPRISPSIIVMIRKGNRILMARKPQFSAGVYALIAGFVEPGETLEEAVQREVKEEVGFTVKNIQYFGSQTWPFPDALMLAFTAEHAEGEIVLLLRKCPITEKILCHKPN